MSLIDQQLTALLEYCTEFARQMIEKAGEFYPFGAEIDASGQVKALGFWDGNEKPSAQELYAFAQNVFTKKATEGTTLGAAIAANVNIPPQYESKYRDGIRVHVEAEGYSRYIYIPYAITKTGLFGRKLSVDYDEMFGVDLPPLMFVPHPDT